MRNLTVVSSENVSITLTVDLYTPREITMT